MNELGTETDVTRLAASATLRELADQLEGEGPVTLTLGGMEVIAGPAEPLTVTLEGNSKGSTSEVVADQRLAIALEWRREAPEATFDVSAGED